MASVTQCPECGGRVSAYAAGCEHCGADLDAHRRVLRETTPVGRPPREWTFPLTKGELAWLAATLFFALYVSPLGVLMGVLGAWDRRDNDRSLAFWLLVACTVLGAVLSVLPLLRGA